MEIQESMFVAARRIGHLSAERELELLAQLDDQRAAETLLLSWIPWLYRRAVKLRVWAPWMEPQDLVQEGLIGMLEATKRFDPKKQLRFSTYACSWAEGYMLRALRHFGSLIPNKEIWRAGKQLTLADQYEIGALADWMAEGIVDDAPPADHDIARHEQAAKAKARVDRAFMKLETREWIILRARLLREPPLSLAELAGRFGVSRERIRQIQVLATNKIKQALLSEAEQTTELARTG